ncbi:transcriptional regulator family: Fungal Specific TF [Paecilomyces variotii]|nr:transcriptional regulator family: Fungal Specific TF [Paecilomyces variotii]
MDDVKPGSRRPRVHRACLNCRRKKVKCPGDQPQCSFCVRLGQRCEYPRSHMSNLSFHQPDATAAYGELASRISMIEARLTGMTPGSNLTADMLDINRSPAETASTPSSNSMMMLDPGSAARATTGFERQEQSQVAEDLPPASVIRSLVDDYFRYSHNQPYSFFHSNSFRLKLEQDQLPGHLLLSVLASAVRFSSEPFFAKNRDAMADSYATRAWKAIVSEWLSDGREGDVTLVQSMTLLAIFDFTECKHRAAWIKIGLAARYAQDLNLMSEPPAELSPADQEEHRRAYWSLYLLDKLITCGRAKPPVFQEHYCRVKLPCTEAAFRLEADEKRFSIEHFTRNDSLETDCSSTFAKVIVTSSVLSQCAQYSLQGYHFQSRKPPWDPRSDHAINSSALLYLETRFEFGLDITGALLRHCVIDGHVDSDAAEPLIFSYILFHLSHCLLHHPFLLRQRLEEYNANIPAKFLARSIAICLQHTQDITRVLREAQKAGCKLKSSFYGFAVVVAGMINALHQHSENDFVRRQAIEDLQFDQAFLDEHAKCWKNSVIIKNALSEFSLESSKFKGLIEAEPQRVQLDPSDAEKLYLLTDYNTLSRPPSNDASPPSYNPRPDPPMLNSSATLGQPLSHSVPQHTDFMMPNSALFDGRTAKLGVSDNLSDYMFDGSRSHET